jgi:hypothetical protein
MAMPSAGSAVAAARAAGSRARWVPTPGEHRAAAPSAGPRSSGLATGAWALGGGAGLGAGEVGAATPGSGGSGGGPGGGLPLSPLVPPSPAPAQGALGGAVAHQPGAGRLR